MSKLLNSLKSSGAFVIYIWLATMLVGVLSWSLTSRMTKTSIKSDLMIVRLIEFFKPSPIIIWVLFIIVLIIAILITIDWLKSKSKK